MAWSKVAQAALKAANKAKKKTGSPKKSPIVDEQVIVQTRRANGQFGPQGKPKGGQTGQPVLGSTTASEPKSSKVKGPFNRRFEYNMEHGDARERTKQVAAISGAITSATGSQAVTDWHESEEKTKRADMKYSAQKESAKAYADAYKNRTVTENKNYSFKGLDQLQKGGATKTVNPADADYENEYSV